MVYTSSSDQRCRDIILTSVILWIATLYGSVHEGAADSPCEISDGTEKWYDNGLF